MNYKHAFLGVLFAGSLFQANAQSKKYTITGSITGVKAGKVYLGTNELKPAVLDSTMLKDGKFSFTGEIESPIYYTIRLDSQRAGIALFLEPGKTSIKAHKDSLNKAIITGSESTRQMREWFVSWGKITALAGVYYRRLDSASEKGKVKVPDAVREQSDKDFAALSLKTKAEVEAFITKYPGSAVAPFIIIDRFINYADPDEVTKTWAMLNDKSKATYYGKKIAAHQNTARKTGIGATPAMQLNDVDGNPVKLADFKGKYVLVDFWASWCGPCRKENPNVVAAYKKYHDKGFEILGVSLDTKKDAWVKAIEADGLTWKHVSDLKGWDAAPVQEFGIKSVPTSFLLDKDGKVIANNLRGEDLHKKLAELLD